MKYIIRSATIIDPASPFHRQQKDLLIDDDKIVEVGENLEAEAEEIKFENLHISPGWIDLYAHFCEPGLEHKEDIASGLNTAAHGGFTGVLIRPDTEPALHSKGEIEFTINRSRGNMVDLLPTGAITKDTAGKELTEIIDLNAAGAKAFGNGEKPLKDAGTLMRSLLYVKPFDGVVFFRPLMRSLVDGPVNEGTMSVQLGMKGSPVLAEELAVYEAIKLAEYTDSHCHLVKISTKKSLELIGEAKDRGVKVSASVAAHHLLLDESVLETFDENYKVSPPLRTMDDVMAMRSGVKDGSIDAVVSDHDPQDTEAKNIEFELAADGIIGLETAFAVANMGMDKELDALITALTKNPRLVLGLPQVSIEKGQLANLTFFDPKLKWTYDQSSIQSKSHNSPFLEKELTGRSLAVMNNGQYKRILNQS